MSSVKKWIAIISIAVFAIGCIYMWFEERRLKQKYLPLS